MFWMYFDFSNKKLTIQQPFFHYNKIVIYDNYGKLNYTF